jgi:c-di-GMP-binding flagellar brake protein YcgR
MQKRTVERRKYRRAKGSFNVKVDTDRDVREMGSYSFKIGKSINISAGGVLFRYDTLVRLGTIIKVTFLKPNSFELFQGRAKVVRTEIDPDSQTYNIGIVFVGLNKTDAEDLNYYIVNKEDTHRNA